jgi:hypothetical protein
VFIILSKQSATIRQTQSHLFLLKHGYMFRSTVTHLPSRTSLQNYCLTRISVPCHGAANVTSLAAVTVLGTVVCSMAERRVVMECSGQQSTVNVAQNSDTFRTLVH